VKEKAFAEAIMVEDESVTIDINTIDVEKSYTGPAIEEDKPITFEWVVSLMEHFKE
jgi:hypothetical protein